MSDKLGRVVNVLTALAGLALAARLAPVPALVAVLAGLGWLVGKGRGAGRVLACSLALGLGAGLGTHLLQGIPHFSLTGRMVGPAVPPLVFRAWLGAAKLSNPANQVGRFGLVAGAALGLVLAAARRREGYLHGGGRVQGRPVIEGGWADDRHLADLVEFGPPRPSRYGGGVVIGKVDGRIVRLPVGRKGLACHTAVFGSTGSGKTFGFVYPNIIAAVYDGASIVVSDPKGELLAGKYNKQGQYEPGIGEFLRGRGYRVLVFNLKNPAGGSHGWNPLAEARDEAEFRALCEAMIGSSGRENPFFKGGETNLFTALSGLTRFGSRFSDEQRHMRTVLSLLAWPVEELDRAFTEEYRAGLPVYFYEKWSSSKAFWGNFATGVANKVAVMTDGALSGVLAGHDIDLVQVAREKTAVFCILPTMGDLRPVLTAFYYLLFKRLVNFAEENHGSLPVPVRFILDEFANIGRVPDFEQRISFDRGLGITYIVIMQALAQFSSLYGASCASTILGQMDVRLSLRVNDLETGRYFCNMFGSARVRETSERRDVTYPWQKVTETNKRSESAKDMKLMEPAQMLQLPFYSATAVIPTKRPMYLATLAFSEMKEYALLPRDPRRIADYAPPVTGAVSVPPVPDFKPDDKPPRRQRERTPGPPEQDEESTVDQQRRLDEMFSGTLGELPPEEGEGL